MHKQPTNTTSIPLMVLNGVKASHKHHKFKDVFVSNNQQFVKPINLKNTKSYKSIYSKKVNLNSRNTNQSGKKRKKGRGYASQHQVEVIVEKQQNGNLYIGPTIGGYSSARKKLTDSASQKFSTVTTSHFNPDSLGLTLNKNESKVRIPAKEQRLNERNFKRHIVTDRYKNIEGRTSKGRFSSQDRKPKIGGKTIPKSTRVRGISGSVMSSLPSTTNNNHHYWLYFNTNNTDRQSKDTLVNDKRRMKNMKHFKKSQVKCHLSNLNLE